MNTLCSTVENMFSLASVYGIRAFPDYFPMKCSWEDPDYLKITLILTIKAEVNGSPNPI